MSRKSAIVIGAGISGLATAALLGKDGWEVTVLEKNDRPGGRAMQLRLGEYLFDMGPSWYLMPDIYERYLALFDASPSDFYSLERLDPQNRIYWDQERSTDVPADPAAQRELFDSFEKNGGAKLERYLKYSQKVYELSKEYFMYNPFFSAKDLVAPRNLVAGMKMGFGVFGSLRSLIEKTFDSEEARKLLLYPVEFLGASPYNAPRLFAMLSHIDLRLGVWKVEDGIYSIVEALEQLCERHGVTLAYSEPVTELVVTDKKCTQVVTSKSTYTADRIISTADYHHTETQLLPEDAQTYPKSYWESKTITPSSYILFLGVNNPLPSLQKHTIIHRSDWESYFPQLFDSNDWIEDPSFYIHATNHAGNKRALSVLVPQPNNVYPSAEKLESFTKTMIELLSMYTKTDITSIIEEQMHFSQNDYLKLYNAYKGTSLGMSQTASQSALFRPKLKSKHVQNMYYAGQYTNPGIGVPMALISAELVTQRINHESK